MDTLQKILDESWQNKMQSNPIEATFYGDHRYNDQLPSLSLESIEKQHKQQQQFLDRLEALDTSQLSDSELIDHKLYSKLLATGIEEHKFKSYLTPINQMSGFHIYLAELTNKMPFETEKDYQTYLSRLSKIEQYVEEHIELMRLGIKDHITIPSVGLPGCILGLEAQLQEGEKNLFYRPFFNLKNSSLCQQAIKIINESLLPSYQRFVAFLKEEYQPAARQTTAVSSIPNGKEYYEYLVRYHTTLTTSPEDIHQIGLGEVKRIRGEMQKILDKLNFTGSLSEFTESLRNDDKFYATTAHQLLAEVSFIMKKMDAQLPKLFNKLPRNPYGISPIPDDIAPRMPMGYYMPSTGDGKTAGIYYINTYDLKSRPLYEMESLSLHEAVPGHHLQIAYQQELNNLPEYRRHSMFTSYVEGWALYAERLGKQAGFYEDPYSDYGRLTYEIWRACRLVVDTGLHALGWSRDEALKYLTENSSLTPLNIETEIDRYICIPGQALAYKMGELKISKLRENAESELKDKFDQRAFHDVLLREGSIPLDMLEENVNSWVKSVLTG